MKSGEAPTQPDTYGLDPERNAHLIRNLTLIDPALLQQILGRSK